MQTNNYKLSLAYT